jgi:hypothetical protein
MSTITVRPSIADLSEEPVRVVRLADDVNSGVGQQVHDPLTGQHGVLGDDYAHGISARRHPDSKVKRPPRAPTRSAR